MVKKPLRTLRKPLRTLRLKNRQRDNRQRDNKRKLKVAIGSIAFKTQFYRMIVT